MPESATALSTALARSLPTHEEEEPFTAPGNTSVGTEVSTILSNALSCQQCSGYPPGQLHLWMSGIYVPVDQILSVKPLMFNNNQHQNGP
jgi:hypothetical protein